MRQIAINCKHMVVTEGPHGTSHLVIFDPDKKTVDTVREWYDSEEACEVQVTDRSGIHTNQNRVNVSSLVHQFGTMVVTVHPSRT